MSMMASQVTGVSSVYSNVGSAADLRKYQNSASLAFVRGIHRWPVNSPHKQSVTPKMFPQPVQANYSRKNKNSALLTPVRGFLSQRANYADILFHGITSSCISIRLFVRLFKGGPLPGPKITFWHLSSPCQQLTSPIKPETPRWRAWHHMQQANSEVQVRMSRNLSPGRDRDLG